MMFALESKDPFSAVLGNTRGHKDSRDRTANFYSPPSVVLNRLFDGKPTPKGLISFYGAAASQGILGARLAAELLAKKQDIKYFTTNEDAEERLGLVDSQGFPKNALLRHNKIERLMHSKLLELLTFQCEKDSDQMLIVSNIDDAFRSSTPAEVQQGFETLHRVAVESHNTIIIFYTALGGSSYVIGNSPLCFAVTRVRGREIHCRREKPHESYAKLFLTYDQKTRIIKAS